MAKPGTPDNMLGANIKYACAKLSECSDIVQHGSCLFPNTLINHASFVMNLYYKTLGLYTCDFNGTGIVVMTNPSKPSSFYHAYRKSKLIYVPHSLVEISLFSLFYQKKKEIHYFLCKCLTYEFFISKIKNAL